MDRERAKKEILSRLKKIEGQLRGLQRMAEEEAPCQDILMQMAAATAALKKVGMVVVQTYMQECLDKTRKDLDDIKGESLQGLQTAISRYMDWA
jgi:DNA-binding FrmR family transcriptional regulator